MVNLSAVVFTVQLLQMTIETFVLCKEGTVREVTIENTYRIMFVQSSYELIACIFDRFEVSWSNVAGDSRESEVFHKWCVAGERGDFSRNLVGSINMLRVCQQRAQIKTILYLKSL